MRVHFISIVAVLFLVACISAAPAATPFAPDDLASTLPSEVGDKQLAVRNIEPEEFGLLHPEQLGVDPSDLLIASAVHRGSDTELSIGAYRARGLGPEQTVAPLLEFLPALAPAVVADREVAAGSGARSVTYLYLKGEVAFMVHSLEVNLETAKAYADAALESLP